MGRVLLAVIAWAAIAAPVAPARHPGKSPCQRLALHHTDRSAHPRLVLAYRGRGERGSIATCLLPQGRVRALARWDDGLERDRWWIVGTRGLYVLIGNAYGDQYGGTSRSLYRRHAVTGDSTTLASYGCRIDFYQPACAEGTSPGRAVVAASGAGAVERTDLATGATTLDAFNAAGSFTTLDEGPVQSLRIAGAELVWLRNGVERRAPLPGASG